MILIGTSRPHLVVATSANVLPSYVALHPRTPYLHSPRLPACSWDLRAGNQSMGMKASSQQSFIQASRELLCKWACRYLLLYASPLRLSPVIVRLVARLHETCFIWHDERGVCRSQTVARIDLKTLEFFESLSTKQGRRCTRLRRS